MRSAQVTVFAIIGILVIIIAAGLIWLTREGVFVGPEGRGPTLDLENCIEAEAIGQIQKVGLSGGVPDGWTIPSGLRAELGSAGAEFGLPPTTRILYGLESSFPLTVQTAGSGYRVGNVEFPLFDGTPDSKPRTGYGLTTMIKEAVEGACAPADGSVSMRLVTFSGDSTIITTNVREPGRSARDVTVTLPIPLRTYHQAVRGQLRTARTDPQAPLGRSGDGYRITTRPNINANNDTLLILESTRPLLGAAPFRYLTIIENRPPVFLTDPSPIVCDADEVDGYDPSDLIDPDPHHTARFIAGSCDDTAGVTFGIESGGKTYTVSNP